MSEPPSVPAHVWPEWSDLGHTEHRHGFVWCRRCGRVLTGRSGIRRDMKPCRVVPITTRAGVAEDDERPS